MQKNIAILIPTINAGGAEKQASLLASRLATKYNVCVILYSGEAKVNIANIQRLEEANIKIHKLIGGTFAKIQELKIKTKPRRGDGKSTQTLINTIELFTLQGLLGED